MDQKTYSIGILSLTAVVLLVANFLMTPRADATQGVVYPGRDYQVVSSPEQSGGDALYVLNNRTGMLAVFIYDAATHRMVPRVVTPISAVFPAAVTTGNGTTGGNGMAPRQR
ncbi:MAG TPA: hypothetical protein VFE58_09090 [Tepidisphaeraceae bacterium]|nr:hypothetical protein [Tepidisphaeraceae bacterium]